MWMAVKQALSLHQSPNPPQQAPLLLPVPLHCCERHLPHCLGSRHPTGPLFRPLSGRNPTATFPSVWPCPYNSCQLPGPLSLTSSGNWPVWCPQNSGHPTYTVLAHNGNAMTILLYRTFKMTWLYFCNPTRHGGHMFLLQITARFRRQYTNLQRHLPQRKVWMQMDIRNIWRNTHW